MKLCLVALLCGLSLLGHASACSADGCSSCSEDMCHLGNGCYDNSPEDWDPSFCISCNGTDLCESSGESELDPSLGCSAETNIIVSLLLGLLGGASACIFPCCLLSMRAKQQWTKSFLDPSNPSVSRVQGRIQDKQVHHGHGEGSTTSFTVVVEFVVGSLPVRGQIACGDEFFQQYSVGREVEIAYKVRDPKDFVIVEVAQEQVATGTKMFVYCVLGVFACVGLPVGGASLPFTGCPVGLAFMVVIIVAGCLCGHFACMPFARSLSQSRFYVTTGGGATPSEKVLGAEQKVMSVLDGRSIGQSTVA